MESQTAPATITYDDVPRTADERTTLLAMLRWQRATLERKCMGLSAEQLRMRSAEPSSLTLLGLVRHMADVERSWFRRTLNGEPISDLYTTPEDADADFNDIADADVDAAFSAWREE